ncbi:MAG: PaaI family thioesterase, partial [Acidimicrobiia bacterium]
MTTPITPKRYSAETAAAIAGSDASLTGLPAYLGIRTVEVGPARMVAELDVREELLNPFGSAHGGVV